MKAMIGKFAKRASLPVLLAAGTILGAAAQAPDVHAADSNVRRAQIGLKIAPVPLNMKGLNEQIVGLGSYLVTVANCNECHTNPEFATGGDPFQGDPLKVVPTAYFAGGIQFTPTVCSVNITPDKNGLPDGLTLANFLSAMQTGHDFRAKPKVLLQFMPWPNYRNMAPADLTAIYEYLKAIPSNKTPKCS